MMKLVLVVSSLYILSNIITETPSSPSLSLFDMQDYLSYKKLSVCGFTNESIFHVSIIVLVLLKYLVSILCKIIYDTTFIKFSVCLNMKCRRCNCHPFTDFNTLNLILIFLYCDNLDSFILILLHWPTKLFSSFALIPGKHHHKSTLQIILCINFLNLMFFMLESIPSWIVFIKIYLSGDVELNPGDNHFTFLNWNLNSITKDNFDRAQLLEAHNSIYGYDLISICETNLNDTIEVPNDLIKDYTFVHCNNPNNTKHGGVGLFYKNTLPVKVRNDLAFGESIVIELLFGRKKVFFTVIYRSPSFAAATPAFQTFLLNFENLFDNIRKEKPYAIFFSGDFNCHSQSWWPACNTNAEGKEIEQLTLSLGLTQIISEPTNFEPHKQPSCVDLIFTDQPNIVIENGTRASLDITCHHQIIFCRINMTLMPPPPYDRKVWHYSRANIDSLRRSIDNVNWEDQFNQNLDPNWQVEYFTKTILNIISNFIPNDIVKVNPKDPPWITNHLKSMIKKQNRLYKNYKRHGYKIEDKIRVDHYNNECKKAVDNAKQFYLNNLSKKINDPNVSKKSYWKFVNKIMNRCKAPKIPPLLVNNTFVTESRMKCNAFVKYFSEQCKLIINSSVLPPLLYLTNTRFNTVKIDTTDILSLIRAINPSKSSGPDDISGRMLLLCDESLVRPLKLIFENILYTGIYPNIWKLANVTPIHKKGDKNLVNNYRPISLLSICSKIFEKIISSQLYSYLVNHKLISENQSGFRPGDSTTNQLIDFVNEIHKAFDNRNSLEVRSIFLDLSKAFDKVWHKGLIFKLRQNGIDGQILKLLESYLCDRKQRVVLNGCTSDFSAIQAGVPQGSVLGPLLFLVFINDLETDIVSKVKFFADDTMIFDIVKDPYVSSVQLNQDLVCIQKWAKQWKMSFNPDPEKQAVEVLFSQKQINRLHPPLFFNGIQVKSQDKHKHLGLLLDTKLSFFDHISEKINKSYKIIGTLRFLSKYLSLHSLDQIYKMMVRPHLDYCDVIYHIPRASTQPFNLNSQMEKLEKVQYNAALAITGAWRGTSRSKLYEELGWESLSDRRWSRRLLQFYKIHKHLTPDYMHSNLPVLNTPQYGLRHTLVYKNIHCNSARYQNSFYPNSIKLWNGLNNEIQAYESLLSFKKHITSIIKPPVKSIYKIFNPFGISSIIQLRVGLSPLKSHKKRHNFLDTPDERCICNTDNENTEHFLLKCPLYRMQRENLITTVMPVLQERGVVHLATDFRLYLYGNSLLNNVSNKKIILAVITFIIGSGRFV